MKKLLFIFLALSLFPLFAELHPARRYVEVGSLFNFKVSENVMPLNEIFKKKLVLDLKKIYSEMSNQGASAGLSASEEFYIDGNFKKFGIGAHFSSSLDMDMNISKDLFKVVESVAPGTVYTAEASVWAQSFAVFSAPVKFNVNKWKIKITPSYFIPLFYVPSTTVSGYAVNGVDGSITVSAVAPIEFYTVTEFKGLIKDGEFSTDFVNQLDSSSLTNDMFASGGIDLSAAVEYPLFDKFDVGGYLSAPLVPGRMKHKVSALAVLSVRTDSLMRAIIDESSPSTTAELSDASYSGANYNVNRPLRLGAECAWRPIGKWLTLRGLLGFGLRNPFGNDVSIKSLYPEYRLGVDVVGLGIFGLSLSTEYKSKVFAHGLDIMLNFRAVEFDFSAAVCSSSFVQSFKGEGVAAGFGVKFGW
ncbi:MAG: hypothetical protein K6A42_10265 [Treponema sp.]|nr:hypothetical protein [Treponema sp.]